MPLLKEQRTSCRDFCGAWERLSVYVKVMNYWLDGWTEKVLKNRNTIDFFPLFDIHIYMTFDNQHNFLSGRGKFHIRVDK